MEILEPLFGDRMTILTWHQPAWIIIIIVKHLCYHTICQMNAIAIAMQAMNRGRKEETLESDNLYSGNRIPPPIFNAAFIVRLVADN